MQKPFRPDQSHREQNRAKNHKAADHERDTLHYESRFFNSSVSDGSTSVIHEPTSVP
jgi:hypothetical protein